jgi:alpha-glucosidase
VPGRTLLANDTVMVVDDMAEVPADTTVWWAV